MTTYRVGDVLAGGYRVIDVKRGGMGVVYISHQPPDRFYAVKTVDPATASNRDPEAIEQFFKYFRDEVDLWIRLSRQARHENIVEALLYNEHQHWLFLEYVDGLSVSEAARRQPIHLKHATRFAVGVARGMDLMHSRFNLIHRDLKPQNVLIAKEGLVPKISDLGIAKVVQEDPGENTVIGTKGYRAPETWAGRTDFVSDVYSFGATLYAMLTGGAPKGRDNPLQTGRKVDPPSAINDRVPPELDALTLKCIEEDPRARYQSFAEIIPLLTSLGPFEGPEYDEGYHYCPGHRYYSWIRDGKESCYFCEQASFSEQQLEKAMTADAADATVVSDAPTDQTMRLPDSVRASHGNFTETAPSGEAGASIPQTMAAPSFAPRDPGVSTSRPTVVGGPKARSVPVLPVALGVIAIVGVVWWAVTSMKDSMEVGPGKSAGEPDAVSSAAEVRELVECQDENCKDEEGKRRRFQSTLSRTVDKDTRVRLQEVCDSNPRHVQCAQCKWRWVSLALSQVDSGCPVCHSTTAPEPVVPKSP